MNDIMRIVSSHDRRQTAAVAEAVAVAATEAGGLRVDPMAQQTRSNAIAPRNEQPQQPPPSPSPSASASASPYPSPSVSAASQQRVAHLAGSQRGHNSTLLITALGTGNRQPAVGNRRPTTARRSAPGTDCSTSSSKNGPGSARVSTWIRARANRRTGQRLPQTCAVGTVPPISMRQLSDELC